MVGTKRRRDADENDDGTPQKLRARIADDVADDQHPLDAHTPSRKGRTYLAEHGTPRSILKKAGFPNAVAATPKSARKLVFETPTKSAKRDSPEGTPTLVRNADRSARRKSNRRMLERTLNGIDSDEDVVDDEDELAQQILDEPADEVEQSTEEAPPEEVPVPDTPSKRGRGTKTSNNTLSAQSLLSHDEYFQSIQAYQDPHQSEIDFLLQLHGRAYDQWIFELEQGFNICLYGYGSKRIITERFTAHLYHTLLERVPYRGTKKTPKIVVINGYAAGTTIKELLTTVASAVVPANLKLPNQPTVLLDAILDHLTNNPPSHPVPVVLNSIDSPYLRKTPLPSMLARLASHPSVNLICTADTPNFSLLWDVGLKTQYKFLFHDATTFAPYDAEMDTVETVNELLGRSGRRVGGRDGVGFVLRSLPEQARELFRILVMEQLALSMMEGMDLDEDDDVTATSKPKGAQAKNALPESTQGVEYRVLYHKAVEAFVCTSEVSFRTLLKEFHDHQMIESRKDGMGTERLWVPFRQEELEGLAEDLAGEAF
ncbi:origin recognition complex subunit 2-domain-containing protein [Bipolaris maydis]|nr:origin recognition complex subunit 2-domain-containing protein [Bipolaris maydis]